MFILLLYYTYELHRQNVELKNYKFSKGQSYIELKILSVHVVIINKIQYRYIKIGNVQSIIFYFSMERESTECRVTLCPSVFETITKPHRQNVELNFFIYTETYIIGCKNIVFSCRINTI